MAHRLLIIDDHPLVRQALAEQFQAHGYVVEVACDGQEALRVLNHFAPHVIVLDFRMPVMDGREFMRRYRERAQPHAPVVLISAEGPVEQLALSIGADAGLAKDPNPEPLCQAVARLAAARSG